MKARERSVKFMLGTLTIFLLFISAAEMFVSIRGTRGLSHYLHDTVSNQLPAVRLITLCEMMHDGLKAVVYSSIVAAASKDESKKNEVMGELKEFSENFKKYLAELKKLELDKSVVVEITKVEPDLTAYIEEASKIVSFALSGNVKNAVDSLESFQKSFESLEASLGSLGDLVEKFSKASMAASFEFEERNDLVLKSAFVIGLIVGLLAFVYVSRKLSYSMNHVSHGINKNADDLSNLTKVLANLGQHLNSASQSQAASLQETASSLAEISSMMEKTKDGGELLEKLANQNTSLIREGSQRVNDMDMAVKEIDNGNNDLFSKLDATSNSFKNILMLIQDIQNKTKVINEIVFQTKLLSFNASVEAARAGDAGKGFAVVAEEVGNLANMSGKASDEISSIIQSSTKAVENTINEVQKLINESVTKSRSQITKGVESTKHCQHSFDKIQEANQAMSKELSNILLALADQTTGIREINTATQDIDHNTQELTSEASKLNSVIIQLKESVDGLAESSSKLQEISGSKNKMVQTDDSAEVKMLDFDEEKKAA